MGKPLNLLNQRFGRLTVIERAEDYIAKSGKHQTRWLCKCDCGNTTIVFSSSLKRELTKSCGCYKKEIDKIKKNGFKHGGKGTRLYRAWRNMKDRCLNPKNSHYKNYGGRGIKVCKKWLNDFKAFQEWAMTNGYKDNLTIDRKNNDGGYNPKNCRWVTQKQNCNNKSNNHLLTYNGETKNIIKWAQQYNIKYETLRCRVEYYGWSAEKALNAPIAKGRWH